MWQHISEPSEKMLSHKHLTFRTKNEVVSKIWEFLFQSGQKHDGITSPGLDLSI